MKYNFVTTVKSKSSPDKEYAIKMRDDGMLTCNCPSWIYNTRRDRTCKHVDEIIRAGFRADKQGKFIVGVDNWGAKIPVCCNNYPEGCDGCSLRFLCYTDTKPEFTKEQLREASVIPRVDVKAY